MSTRKPSRAFKGVWIPRDIWDSKDLSWLEKCLLAEIESLDDGNGCWATNQHLSDQMGSTPGSIAAIISKLRHHFWVVDLTESDSRAGQRDRRLKVVANDILRAKLKEKMAEISAQYSLTGVNHSLTAVNESLIAVKELFASHIVREIPKEKPSESVAAKAAGESRTRLIEEWSKAFQTRFKRKYFFNGSRDGKAVNELLAIEGETWESVLAVAKQAWGREATNFAWCNHALTLHGLRDKWNQIRHELDKEPAGPKIPLFKQIESLKNQAATHPANPDSIAHSTLSRAGRKPSTEQIQDYRKIKEKLNELEKQQS